MIQHPRHHDQHNLYDQVAVILRNGLKSLHETVDNMGIMKPYSFVLENDDHESLAELYLVDDDVVIIGGDLMEGLDKELDDFLGKLLEE